jgi:hypothetical protein
MTDPSFSVAPSGDVIRDRLTILTNQTLYRRGQDVLICMLDHGDRIVSVAEPIVFFKKPPEEFEAHCLQPTISGPEGLSFLQSALDAAWAAGLRPKNWRLETTEQVAAMNNHLQDMRALVFGGPVPLPAFIKPEGRQP